MIKITTNFVILLTDVLFADDTGKSISAQKTAFHEVLQSPYQNFLGVPRQSHPATFAFSIHNFNNSKSQSTMN